MIFPSLKHRRRFDELMDAPDADPRQLDDALAFLRKVNTRLGYTRSTIRHLDALVAGIEPTRPLRVLDVATGGGDVPRALLVHGERVGRAMEVVGIDLHDRTIRYASAQGADPRLAFVRGDATALPFADRSFDVATASLFLHHLDEDVIVRVLREMARVSRVGLIVGDLLRRTRAYAWISLFTLLANPMVRHDARVSVRQAFRRGEILTLASRAGLQSVAFHEHFGHRFVLVGRTADAARQDPETSPCSLAPCSS
jgi:SAM-dependent methyltransferase